MKRKTKKSKLDKLQEKLDLSKRFPDFFHKPYFQIAAAAMFILGLLVFFIDGIDPLIGNTKWVECPASAGRPCENPMYNRYPGQASILTSAGEEYPEEWLNPKIGDPMYDDAFIPPGVTYGNKPSKLAFIAEELLYTFMILPFIFCTGRYYYKKRLNK